jgi:hypothetical protein
MASSAAARPSLVEALQQPPMGGAYSGAYGQMGREAFSGKFQPIPICSQPPQESLYADHFLTSIPFDSIDVGMRHGDNTNSPLLQQFGLGSKRMDVSLSARDYFFFFFFFLRSCGMPLL